MGDMSSGAASILDSLADQAAQLPDHTAFVGSGSESLTWSELAGAVEERAARLAGSGIGRDHIVLVSGLATLDFYLLALAVGRLGAVLAPLNLQFTGHEYEQYVKQFADLQPLAFVSDVLFRDRFEGLDPGVPRFALDEHASDERWRPLGEATPEQLGPPPGPEDPAFLVSTSGSTGFPKPALIPHRAATHLGRVTAEATGMTPDDRILGVMPMFHIGGLGGNLALPLTTGASIHALAMFEPAESLRRIEEERITVMNAFDTLIERIMGLPDFDVARLRSLRRVTFAGSAKYYEALRSWGPIDIGTAYAMTEAWTVSLTPPGCDDERLKRWSQGRIVEGMEVRIVDPVQDTRCADGVSGEIRVRGDGTFLRYLGLDEETARTFDDEGYVRTGDIGHLEGDYLFFEGRYKAMIKTGGENVSELEVENFLVSEFPEIHVTAVVGAPDPEWGEAVCAFVELEPGETLTLEELRVRCREKLAGFKIPRRLEMVETGGWPHGATGKIDKHELRRRLEPS